MDAQSIELLTTTVNAKHSIIAWINHEAGNHTDRYAAMWADPVNVNDAREWLMKGSQATRRLLHNRKGPYDPTKDGPLFSLCREGEHPMIVASGDRKMWMDVPL